MTGLVLIFIAGCGTNPEQPASDESGTELEESMSMEGVSGRYEGTLPCEDCTAIFVMIGLEKDLTYELNAVYLDKSESTFQTTGSYTIDSNTGLIKLSDSGSLGTYLKLTDGYLIYLDKDGGEPIAEEGQSYILRRAN